VLEGIYDGPLLYTTSSSGLN